MLRERPRFNNALRRMAKGNAYGEAYGAADLMPASPSEWMATCSDSPATSLALDF